MTETTIFSPTPVDWDSLEAFSLSVVLLWTETVVNTKTKTKTERNSIIRRILRNDLKLNVLRIFETLLKKLLRYQSVKRIAFFQVRFCYHQIG